MIINLVRERVSENETWIDVFELDDNIRDAETEFRNAVADYLSTDLGKQAITWTNGDFNWGDAIMCVPNNVWFEHGIRPLSFRATNIVVNQDEVLCETIV